MDISKFYKWTYNISCFLNVLKYINLNNEFILYGLTNKTHFSK